MGYLFPPFFVSRVLLTVIMQPTLEKIDIHLIKVRFWFYCISFTFPPPFPPPKKTKKDMYPYPVISATCKQGNMIQYPVNEMLLLLDSLNSMNTASPAPHVTLFTEHQQ
jgi:hypothetical protein